MIFIEKLFRKRLESIIKNYQNFTLIFDDNGYKTEIHFEGFLFESEFTTIGERVLNVRMNSNLGVNGLDILRYYRLNTIEYKQLTIEFEETNYRKTDLVCVYKHYEIK